MWLLLFVVLAECSLLQESRLNVPFKFRAPSVHKLTKRAPRRVAKSSLKVTFPSKAWRTKQSNPVLASGPTGTHVFPLQGSLDTTASFYLSIGIGTPAQFVNLLIDTGSTDLVVFATGCSGCPANATSYDLSKSRTGSEQTCDQMNYACSNQCDNSFNCHFEDDYGGGGSITGVVVQDTVWFPAPGWNQSNVYFGQIQDDNVPGDFVIPPEDGIIGFAFEGLSAWQQSCAFSYMSHVYQSISLCTSVTPAPVIELGNNYYGGPQKSQFQWTTLYNNPGWFNVWVSDAGMAGKTLGLGKDYYGDANGYGTIMDSGTTLLIVTTKMYQIYTQRLQAMCQQGVNLVGVCNQTFANSILNGTCWNMTQQQVNAYPSMYFTFWNHEDSSKPFTLTIGPQAILVEICGGPGQGYAFGVQAMDDTPIILGDVLLSQFHVVFDKNKMVVGFRSTSGCPAPQ